MKDFVKAAEKNCVNIAKHMNDMFQVVSAMEAFGSRFLDERYEGEDFQKGTRLIRNALYVKYMRSICDCFLFVGVGGKEAEKYSKEQFAKLFGNEENAIMNLLDQYGNYPSWYDVDEEDEFRKQAKKKIKKEQNDENS